MLPFCFGLILITSCLHRKDTRLSPRYIFTFQGSLGMSLCDIILTRSLWTTCSHHSRASVPTFTCICVPYFFHQMPRLYFFINFFFLVLVRLLLNITKVLARPFPKGTVPFGASNVPFGSATKETMCPLVSPQGKGNHNPCVTAYGFPSLADNSKYMANPDNEVLTRIYRPKGTTNIS